MDDFASFQANAKDGWEEEIKKFAASYHGKGEGEMMKELLSRAMEGKKKGTLTNEQIDAFYRQFAPALDGIKRKKLQKIVEKLKAIN